MNAELEFVAGLGNYFLGQEYPRRGADADHTPERPQRRQPSPKLNGEILREQLSEGGTANGDGSSSGWGFTKQSRSSQKKERLHFFVDGRSVCHGTAPDGELSDTVISEIACPACLERKP